MGKFMHVSHVSVCCLQSAPADPQVTAQLWQSGCSKWSWKHWCSMFQNGAMINIYFFITHTRIVTSHPFSELSCCSLSAFPWCQAQTVCWILNYSITQFKSKALMSQLTRCRASGGLLRWPNLFGGECDALIPTNIFSPCVTWVMIHYYHCYDSL